MTSIYMVRKTKIERIPVFVDTSALAALINKKDQYHEIFVPLFVNQLSKATHQIFTSYYILDELVALLTSKRVRKNIIIERIETILDPRAGWKILHVDDSIWNEAWKLYRTYMDKQYSMTDCVSFVIMHRFNIRHALTTDSHFEQMGFIRIPKI